MMWSSDRGWDPLGSRVYGVQCVFGLLWVLLLSGTTPLGAAEYIESYAKGVEAYESQQWADAAQWFRRSVEEQPMAGGRVAVAGESQVYVPYHQLALALYFGDVLEEAEQMWVKSMEQGVVVKEVPEALPRIKTYRADIAERLEIRESMRRAVNKQLKRATRQIVLLDEPRLQWVLGQDADLSRDRQAALETLERARSLHGQSQASEDQLSDAHALAVQSASALESVVLKATRQAIEEEGS